MPSESRSVSDRRPGRPDRHAGALSGWSRLRTLLDCRREPVRPITRCTGRRLRTVDSAADLADDEHGAGRHLQHRGRRWRSDGAAGGLAVVFLSHLRIARRASGKRRCGERRATVGSITAASSSSSALVAEQLGLAAEDRDEVAPRQRRSAPGTSRWRILLRSGPVSALLGSSTSHSPSLPRRRLGSLSCAGRGSGDEARTTCRRGRPGRRPGEVERTVSAWSSAV